MNSSQKQATVLIAQSINSCRNARYSAIGSILFAAIVQLLIDTSVQNASSVFIVTITCLITFYIIFRASVIRVAPLPVFVILGFNVATLSGALVFQSLYLTPIVFNLQVPIFTFAACAFFQISLLIALGIFLYSSTCRGISKKVNEGLLKPLGIMAAPSQGQLWLIGLTGCLAIYWVTTKSNEGGVEFGDVGGKFLIGIRYLAYAPFLIPVLNNAFAQVKNSYNTKINTGWLLILYFLGLVILGILRNSRGTFAMGIANLGIAALLLYLLGQLTISKQILHRFLVVIALTVFVSPVLSDLAITMVVVRGERSSITNWELLSRTVETFQDKQALKNYRSITSIVVDGQYTEKYIDNVFLSRFVQTKFFDNTLSYDEVISGKHAGALWGNALDRILSLLPTPVLKLFAIDLDKSDLAFSTGDFLYALQTGENSLGGYRTGSPLGHGLGLMGPTLFVAVIPLFILNFMALNSLTLMNKGIVSLSPLILLQVFSYMFLFAKDSLLDGVTMLLRGLPQQIFIYCLIFYCTRWILSFNPLKLIYQYR